MRVNLLDTPKISYTFRLYSKITYSGFGGLGVSVLASGTQVRGFKLGRRRRIFKGGKKCTVEVGT
jgi:hypothetical protein